MSSAFGGDGTAYRPDEPYALVIGGERVRARDAFDAIEPSSGERWAEIPEASAEDVDAAVQAAKAAFSSWRWSRPAQRQAALWQIADRIEADGERWASLLATENGRPIREAEMADVPTAAAIFRYFSGLARGIQGDQIPVEDPNAHVVTIREPLGVIGTLIPWNSPLITLANKVAPALAAGNAVVMKPSELASASVLELAYAVEDLLPPGALNVVTGFGPDVGAALVSHPDLAKISFTGGTQTGRRIMEAAGRQLTPAIMELGGNGPMVVCEDADLDVAVTDAMTGTFLAVGQACVASARVMVHESVREEFVSRFATRMERLRVGDALDPETQLGPVVSHDHRERVLGYVEAARREGATVAHGGRPLEPEGRCKEGFFLEPTIVDDPEGASTASREEIFGPVLAVQAWEDEDEVIQRANDTRYGLAAGVWTRDLARAHRFARQLQAGIVWVNKWFDLSIGAPMGGVKDSGFGRETAAETLQEYTASKTVNIDTSTARPPLWG